MANPIIEQIAVKIATALAAITDADGATQAVTNVYRPETIEGYGRTSPANYSIDFLYGDPVRVPEIDAFGSNEIVGWDQPFDMFLNLKATDAGGTILEQIVEIFCSQVIKKLMATPTWDGLAMNTFLGDQSWFINDEDGVIGKNIRIIVRYRVRKNDPYNQT
jgi:hypothetical protein